MEKKFFLLSLFFIAMVVLLTNCKKEYDMELPPNAERQEYEIFMKTPDNQNFATKTAVADGQVVHLPDSGLTVLFWTDPLTSVDWELQGPQNDYWDSADQISVVFDYSGTYTLNIVSLGIDWNVTVVVGGNPSISQVGTRFLGATYSGGEFHYSFRINQPVYVTQSDTLFRVNELADDPNAEYLPNFQGVEIVPGLDSIDLTFSYPPSGNEFISVKFIAGRMEGGDPVWFNADPDDPYKCQDAPPLLSDILQANLKNGLALPPDGDFPVPSNASPTMGDYNEEVPVILMNADPGSQTLDIWFFTSSEDPVFRYKVDESQTGWTEITDPSSAGGNYWNVQLSTNTPEGYYIFEFGEGSGANFVPDELIQLSSMYYSPYSALVIYL